MSSRFLTGLALAAALAPLVSVVDAAPKKSKPAAAVAAAPAPTEPAEADYRTPNPDDLLIIDTNKGRIIIEMYPEVAPLHVAQIRTLAKRHFYDGQTFFRVIDDFMDQTGDPDNSGKGGSDLPNLKAEFTFKRGPDTPFVSAVNTPGASVGFIGALPVGSQPEDLMAMMANGTVSAWSLFCPGVAAMARAGDPDSANSQFFLMRGAYPSLTKKYTAWGRVLVGQSVVTSIKVGEPPEPPLDKMVTVRLASDLPEASRPKVRVLDSRSAVFRARLAKFVADKGADFSVCDFEIPAKATDPAK